MKSKFSVLLFLFFLKVLAFGQIANKDSLRLVMDSLKLEREQLKKRATGCSDFKTCSSPKWANINSNNNKKTYYKSCQWSETYVVINSDSTFLYKHNGEGGANFLQKGNWEMTNDSTLVLRNNDSLTNGFKITMKQFEKTNYKSGSLFLKKLIQRKNELVEPSK